MPTVFVTNKGGHDFSPALKHGEIVYLSVGEQPQHGVTQAYRLFAPKLLNSHPDDMIIMSGLPVHTMVAAAIFGYLHGRVNILIYQRGKYIKRQVHLDELLSTDKENNFERETGDLERGEPSSTLSSDSRSH